MKYKGFTLVEMMLAMGIFSILIVIMSGVFSGLLEQHFRNITTTALAQDSRYIFSRLAYDTVRATTFATPNPQTLVLTVNSQTLTYTITNNVLTLAVDGGPAQALCSVGTSISQGTFTLLPDSGGKHLVSVSLTLAAPLSQATRTLNTTFATR